MVLTTWSPRPVDPPPSQREIRKWAAVSTANLGCSFALMSISFELSEEQLALQASAKRVAEEVYKPRERAWAEQECPLPSEERKRLGGLGFLGLTLPERFGGSEANLLEALIVIEELAKSCQVAAFQVFEATTGPARVIELFGTEDQKNRYLPSIVAGQTTLAVAISEPGAGSAATDLKTHARLVGDEFVVRGTKRWCSGAGHAEQYLVYVRLTEESGSASIGALVVDRDSSGLRFGPPERLMGFRGIPSADMHLDDVRVPRDNLIIPAGGFKRLFSAFSIERLGNATMALAIGQSCLERTATYVQEREQFGKPIVDFQLVQASLADMVIQVEAARLLIWRAAARAGRGTPSALEASIAKCFANEMSKKVSDIAMQLHGGYGYSVEYGIERMHRDAHGWALAGGTTNLQRIRIAAEYLGRSFGQR